MVPGTQQSYNQTLGGGTVKAWKKREKEAEGGGRLGMKPEYWPKKQRGAVNPGQWSNKLTP